MNLHEFPHMYLDILGTDKPHPITEGGELSIDILVDQEIIPFLI